MPITLNGSTGITSPEVTLDNTSADGGQVVLKSSGYDNWNLDNFNGRFRAYNGSTERMTIDTSGNVGIGTASPSSRLEVKFATNDYAYFSNTGDNNTGIRIQNTGRAYGIFVDGGSGSSNALRFYDFNAATDRMRLDSSGNLQFNSGYGSVATAYGCRAWVNFNSSGTIRASGNVSSITVRGTGEYTVNFTTAMPDTNYSAVFGATATGIGGPVIVYDDAIAPTSSALAVESGDNSSKKGFTYMNVAVFR